MAWLASIALFLLVSNSHGFIMNKRASRDFSLIQSAFSNIPDDVSKKEAEKLLSDALRLRDEVQSMESSINRRVDAAAIHSKPSYNQLSGSYWSMSYRFSPEPIQDQEQTVRFFSGKVRFHLRRDGYTDYIVEGENTIQIKKFWGWDEEVSEQDQKTYLMFAADVIFSSTPIEASSTSKSQTSKVYFNALVEKDKSDNIELSDGIITVKRDIISNPPRLLGMFNAGGILAEFKTCGSFICKPSIQFDSIP